MKRIFLVVIVLLVMSTLFLSGFFVGKERIKRNLNYIKKQEMQLLKSKQGPEQKSILELLVEVDKKLETTMKELPHYFARYNKLEKEYLSERQKMVDKNERMFEKIKDLESQFLQEKDLQTKVAIGTDIVDKFVEMGEINSNIIEIDDKRFLSTYEYTNFLYSKIEDLLLVYGYERND